MTKYAYQIVLPYPQFGVTGTGFNVYDSAIVVGVSGYGRQVPRRQLSKITNRVRLLCSVLGLNCIRGGVGEAFCLRR